jgi:hypothetical protein
MTARSVPTGCTGRVFHASRGKHLPPLATPGPRRLVRLELRLLGFCSHETVESAAVRVLTDFCNHNPTVVSLSLLKLFPAVSPHDPALLDRMDHLRELLLLAEPLDVTQTLARCLNVAFTLQGQCLEAARWDW